MIEAGKQFVGGAVGTSVSAVGTATQTNETLQTISLIITIIGAIISMIVIPIISWYKNAKKDGKITKDEVKEGLETLEHGIKDVKESLDDKKGDNK